MENLFLISIATHLFFRYFNAVFRAVLLSRRAKYRRKNAFRLIPIIFRHATFDSYLKCIVVVFVSSLIWGQVIHFIFHNGGPLDSRYHSYHEMNKKAGFLIDKMEDDGFVIPGLNAQLHYKLDRLEKKSAHLGESVCRGKEGLWPGRFTKRKMGISRIEGWFHKNFMPTELTPGTALWQLEKTINMKDNENNPHFERYKLRALPIINKVVPPTMVSDKGAFVLGLIFSFPLIIPWYFLDPKRRRHASLKKRKLLERGGVSALTFVLFSVSGIQDK